MSCSIFALYLPEARWHQLFNLPCSPRCCCGIVSLFPITERQGRDVLLPKITPVEGYLCRAVCHWSQTCHVASVRFIFLRQDRINLPCSPQCCCGIVCPYSPSPRSRAGMSCSPESCSAYKVVYSAVCHLPRTCCSHLCTFLSSGEECLASPCNALRHLQQALFSQAYTICFVSICCIDPLQHVRLGARA